MHNNIDMDSLFEGVYKKLTMDGFGKSLGGELPLFIQPIPPERQLEATGQINRLIGRMAKKGINAISINLYDLCMNVLEEEGVLETLLDEESSIPRENIISTLDSLLDIKDVIIPRIKMVIDENNPAFVFIDGVGSVYPFIRSHGILNNIDVLANGCNLVLFFPGDYNNLQLKLFGRIVDENYYRGHNLNEIKTA